MCSLRLSHLHPASACAVLLALCGSVHAETSIKLTGMMDLGIRSVQNSSGRVHSLVSGSSSTSRIALVGTEDLGDGYFAKIHLEGSIAADTGTPGTGAQFFDRQSTIAVGGPFGELRLGRDWTPTYFGFLFADPFLNTGVGAGANFLNASAATTYQRAFGSAPNPTTLSRSSNAIEYLLPPKLGGMYGVLMYAPSENANAAGSFRYRSGRLGLVHGRFDVSVYGGTTRIDATGRELKQAGIFNAVKIDKAKVSLSVTESRYLDSRHLHVMGGVRADLERWVLKASFNRIDQRGVNSAGASIEANDANQFALGADYKLSKSGTTAIYTHAARLSNKGAATFAVPGGPPNVAPGSKSTGYELGLRHSF